MSRTKHNQQSKPFTRGIELELLEGRLLLSDVQFVLLSKTETFKQTSSGAPSPVSAPYYFDVLVIETALGTVSSASFQETSPTTGTVTSLTELPNPVPGYAQTSGNDIVSKSDFDAAYPGGSTYNVSIDAVNDGTHTLNMGIGPTDDYPAAPPQVTNYNALQAIDPSSLTTISWNAFAGGTTNDIIIVTLADSEGNPIAILGGPGPTNHLDGTSTSVTIPAGTLSAGATYGIGILFAKVTSTDTTDYPGVVAYAAYEDHTKFNITTTNSSFATLSGGVLSVSGTPGMDTISLQADGSGNVTATLNGQTSQAFPLSQITSIDVAGGGGNDTITIGAGVPGCSIGGGAGDDTITGGQANDTIAGGAGNDLIAGGPGDDSLRGGAGDDTIAGGAGNDIVVGGAGDDSLKGGAGNDSLTGGAGNNTLRGNAGDDTFFAINGNADTLYGGAGNNTAHIDAGLDQIPNNDIQNILDV